jgi:YegS/Rv2252/BmrU family lipid kinase
MSKGINKIAFVINPISGKGKGLSCEPLILEMFNKTHELRLNVTKGVGDGLSLAKQALEDGYNTIVAVGGDGTVNEVGTALIGSDALLGIIPVGSGNGLARHLNIPMNPTKAMEILKASVVTKIDTGKMNDRVFLNAAGVGLDAEVSKLFASSVQRGWIRYLKIILKLGRKQREFNATLNINKQTKKTRITMLTVANSTQYGNNAKIAPMADISDGKLDICILHNMNYLRSLSFLTALMSGRLKSGKYYDCEQSERLEFDSNEKWAHVDGEPLEIKGNLVFQSIPKSLNVIC